MKTPYAKPILPAGFTPCDIQGDTDGLSRYFERLLIKFPLKWEPGEPVDTVVAPLGILTAGWVIGLRIPKRKENHDF